MKKSVRSVRLVAMVLLSGIQPLIGRALFQCEGEVSENMQQAVEAMGRNNRSEVDFYFDTGIFGYEGDQVRFKEGKTLPIEIIEAIREGRINSANGLRYIGQIVTACPGLSNNRDNFGKNALDHAIDLKLPEIVEGLLDDPGIRFDVFNNKMGPFIDMIIHCGNLGLIKKADKRRMTEDQLKSILDYAWDKWSHMNAGNSEEVKHVAGKYCDLMILILDLKKEKAKARKGDELINAIVEDDIENICHLLETDGLNINHQDQGGYTPLMWAVAMGNFAIVCEILARGPDLNMRNNEGKTAFDIAQQNRNEDIVGVLSQVRRG
jgi:ankyrin repeat protein